MPSSHFILCCPLLLLPPIPPSIRVFSNESTRHMRWPQYWSFSFSISPSKEHPGLISFRMDWLDLLAVQGTLKSLPLLKKEKQRASYIIFSNSFALLLFGANGSQFPLHIRLTYRFKNPSVHSLPQTNEIKTPRGGPPSGYFKHPG